MQISVRYFAAAIDAVGHADDRLDVDDGITLAGVRALLEENAALTKVLRRSRLALNQRFVDESTVVVAGAEVAVIPPVAGG